MENNNGTGGAFILFIVFLILKLTGTIAWSWWWVTCPLWAGLAIIFGLAGVIFAFGVAGTILGGTFVLLKGLFARKQEKKLSPRQRARRSLDRRAGR